MYVDIISHTFTKGSFVWGHNVPGFDCHLTHLFPKGSIILRSYSPRDLLCRFKLWWVHTMGSKCAGFNCPGSNSMSSYCVCLCSLLYFFLPWGF
jgi:hypothetical protein